MISVIVAASTLCLFLMVLVLKKWNENRHVIVNCWFCGEDSLIKYQHSSWWFCRTCEQHNGFKENGDYKEPIPEMYNDPPDTRKFCINDDDAQFTEKENILCPSCQKKQTLKLNDISSFVPSREGIFDEEFDDYKVGLENKHKLCLTCEMAVSYHLQQQDHQIKRTYCFQNLSNEASDKFARKLQTNMLSSNSTGILVKLCHLLSLSAAYWLYMQEHKDELSSFLLNGITAVHVFISVLLISCNNKLFEWGFVSTTLWIAMAMYRNYEMQESQKLFYYMLSFTICLESTIFTHALVNSFINVRKKWKYLDQRKRKLEGARNSPKFRSLHSNALNYEKNAGTYEDDSSAKSILQGQLNSVTPDLLHGHLDAMYIERIPTTSQERNNGETNHVVAALKYMPSKFCISSTQPKPLLRPATLVWNGKSTLQIEKSSSWLEEKKFKNSSDEKLSNINKKVRNDERIEEENQLAEISSLGKSSTNGKVLKRCSCWTIFIVCFILSVACNIYFMAF